MNRFYIMTLCLILAFGKIYAQSDTYQIETISKPTKLLETVSSSMLYPNVDKNFVKLSVSDKLVDLGTNPVISGYLKAYQNHYPLTISPDIAWLLICQGFANHINSNPEKFRSKIVGFKGKETLTVKRDISSIKSLNEFQWETVFPEFTAQIAAFTGRELIDNLSADFTTTTPKSLIASQITIMESTKEFFNYKISIIGCGISKVTVEGSVKDWEKILKRLDYVGTFDLQWWTSELKPIIQKIIDTKNGKLDKQFWMNMVKYHKVGIYGSYDGIDGWLLKFYPYLQSTIPLIAEKNGNTKNVVAEAVLSYSPDAANKNRTLYLRQSEFKEIKNINDLPKELANVPFLVEVVDKDGNLKHSYQMEFWAGFMGVIQDTKSYNVKPEVGWAVNLKTESSNK